MSDKRLGIADHNLFIVWKPEYDLGIPIIDEQHRGIVTTINSLHFALQRSTGERLLHPIIAMITEYTHIHFETEEAYINKCSAAESKRHHGLHDNLIHSMLKIGSKSELEHDPYQFMNFLKHWWIDHICNEDQIFKKYLKASDA